MTRHIHIHWKFNYETDIINSSPIACFVLLQSQLSNITLVSFNQFLAFAVLLHNSHTVKASVARNEIWPFLKARYTTMERLQVDTVKKYCPQKISDYKKV